MKLPKEMIAHMSRNLVERLTRKGYLVPRVPREDLVARIDQIITADLMVEDKLDEEVRAILKSYEDDIDRGRMDERKMFRLIKDKLAKDRGLIL